MKTAIMFGVIGVGFLLLILSGFWTALFPGRSQWTDEKAARWAVVKDRLHNLSFVVNAPPGKVSMHSGPDLGKAKAEYDAIKQEATQLQADFEMAYDSPRTTATVLKWSGISLAVVGLMGWYAVKNS
jgi:hypothetical protein